MVQLYNISDDLANFIVFRLIPCTSSLYLRSAAADWINHLFFFVSVIQLYAHVIQLRTSPLPNFLLTPLRVPNSGSFDRFGDRGVEFSSVNYDIMRLCDDVEFNVN